MIFLALESILTCNFVYNDEHLFGAENDIHLTLLHSKLLNICFELNSSFITDKVPLSLTIYLKKLERTIANI